MPMASMVRTPSSTIAMPVSSTPSRSWDNEALGCASSVFMATSMNSLTWRGAFMLSV